MQFGLQCPRDEPMSEQEQTATYFFARAAMNLLAVLHRDGGHHTEAVGFVQSCLDAEQAYYALRAEIERLKQSGREYIALTDPVLRHAEEQYEQISAERDALKAESEGRLRVLNEKAAEAKAEWERAERAEAQLAEAQTLLKEAVTLWQNDPSVARLNARIREALAAGAEDGRGGLLYVRIKAGSGDEAQQEERIDFSPPVEPLCLCPDECEVHPEAPK
jgi:DNA repair exonuclease SbcCD ATPase subunit